MRRAKSPSFNDDDIPLLPTRKAPTREVTDYHLSVSSSLPGPRGRPEAKTRKSSQPRLKGAIQVGFVLLLVIFGIMAVESAYPHLKYALDQNATAVARNATATAQAATATAVTVAKNPFPSYMHGHGTLALYDPLTEPFSWYNSSDSNFGGSCQFTAGALHVSQIKSRRIYDCNQYSNLPKFSDFAFEVMLVIRQGDCGGLGFRQNISVGSSYFFEICQDRVYNLYRYSDFKTSVRLPTPSVDNSAIHGGLGQSNRIAVLVSGSTLTLFVNNQQIASVQDGTYTEGSIYLSAHDITNPTAVVYNKAKVWTL